jgi:hypothetical protein
MLDRVGRAHLRPLQEHLSGEEGPVQGARGQDRCGPSDQERTPPDRRETVAFIWNTEAGRPVG